MGITPKALKLVHTWRTKDTPIPFWGPFVTGFWGWKAVKLKPLEGCRVGNIHIFSEVSREQSSNSLAGKFQVFVC